METYTEKVLYGTLKEDPIWKEQILTNQEQHFNEAKAWAERNGFHRLRIAEIDLSRPPDFTSCIKGESE
tara:strand:+ start:167 stop:373 length:207 start_codon:yes stop_codon:yes gene_type:complete